MSRPPRERTRADVYNVTRAAGHPALAGPPRPTVPAQSDRHDGRRPGDPENSREYAVAAGTPVAGAPDARGAGRLTRDGDLAATLRLVAPALDGRRAVVTSPTREPQPREPRPTREPPGDGWLRCTDLQTPERLGSALALLQRVQGSSREVAASYYLAWYAAGVVGPAVAAYAVARRVPCLEPAGMSLHLHSDGWFDVTAFHGADMVVLADDPLLAAAGTAASAVADDDALLGMLVGELVGHLEPVVVALRSRVRLGLPALWGAVSTQCARTFLLTEKITGDPHAGRAEADAFFAAACPPLRARPTWHEFVHRGRHHTGMRRGSCCLAHRLSTQYCTTCPFTPDAERERRLRDWIDIQGTGGLAL